VRIPEVGISSRANQNVTKINRQRKRGGSRCCGRVDMGPQVETSEPRGFCPTTAASRTLSPVASPARGLGLHLRSCLPCAGLRNIPSPTVFVTRVLNPGAETVGRSELLWPRLVWLTTCSNVHIFFRISIMRRCCTANHEIFINEEQEKGIIVVSIVREPNGQNTNQSQETKKRIMKWQPQPLYSSISSM
jgi:hypothetical protein